MEAFQVAPYRPTAWLRNAHVQTVFGSRGRSRWIARQTAPFAQASVREILTTGAGVRLEAWLNLQRGRPVVVIIHGWLGRADSSYVLAAGAALSHAGFSVARLNLRDHGDTANLNESLFNSARIEEVIDAVRQIQSAADSRAGLLGFSLGGNFALRVAKATGIHAVAVCPAMDPAASTVAIDNGLAIYRWFFLRKWRAALAAKQGAFPERYDFTEAMQLNRVASLTELFVRDHTPFPSVTDYFARYTLTGSVLQDTPATIVYAEDDPVIPAAGFVNLPDTLSIVASPNGGHCAFVTHPRAPSWIDRYAVARFTDLLT